MQRSGVFIIPLGQMQFKTIYDGLKLLKNYIFCPLLDATKWHLEPWLSGTEGATTLAPEVRVTPLKGKGPRKTVGFP